MHENNTGRKPLKIALIALSALLPIIAIAAFVLWNVHGRQGLDYVDAHTPYQNDDATAYPDYQSYETTVYPDYQNDDTDIYPEYPENPAQIELTGFAADGLYLVGLIEATHPIFVIDGWLGHDYEDIRDHFLAYTQNPDITRQDFLFAAARYITTLRDGHMNMALLEDPETWEPAIFGGRLDIDWQVQDDSLALLDSYGVPTQAHVIEIGGVAVSQVFAVIERYFYAENIADHESNMRTRSRYRDVIIRAGGTVVDDAVEITVYENGQTNLLEVPILSFETLIARRQEHQDSNFIIRYEMIGDIFLIDLRTFVDGDHITEATSAIQQAVSDGIYKFIVDLRGNSGGNSHVGTRLLSAMGVTTPSYGAVRRLSDVMLEDPFFNGLYIYRRAYDLGLQYRHYHPRVIANNNPNNVFVSVLTDASTYSSATMMSTWVQDGGFGNIIGSPSRNSPTMFGHWIGPVTLPYSGIDVMLSSSQFIRPDADADPTTLWPDIMVDPADALDAAIEYLYNLGT